MIYSDLDVDVASVLPIPNLIILWNIVATLVLYRSKAQPGPD